MKKKQAMTCNKCYEFLLQKLVSIIRLNCRNRAKEMCCYIKAALLEKTEENKTVIDSFSDSPYRKWIVHDLKVT